MVPVVIEVKRVQIAPAIPGQKSGNESGVFLRLSNPKPHAGRHG